VITRRGTKNSIFLTAAAIVSAVGLLSGCSAAAPKATPKADAKLSAEEYSIALKKCMSKEGVETKSISGGKAIRMDSGAEAAMETCTKKLGTPPQAENTQSPEKTKEETLKTAKCLRENGVDVEMKGDSFTIKSDLPEEAAKKCLGDVPGAPAGAVK
jgi:hypothetical protein